MGLMLNTAPANYLKDVEPYESEAAFLRDLQRVFEKDYGTRLEG